MVITYMFQKRNNMEKLGAVPQQDTQLSQTIREDVRMGKEKPLAWGKKQPSFWQNCERGIKSLCFSFCGRVINKMLSYSKKFLVHLTEVDRGKKHRIEQDRTQVLSLGGRSRRGNSDPLQYSCLENST